MFYLLITILLVVLYVFAAPKTIKGTLNTVVLVLLLVAAMIGLAFLALGILQSPPQIFIIVGMILLLYYSMRDLARMPARPKKTKR